MELSPEVSTIATLLFDRECNQEFDFLDQVAFMRAVRENRVPLAAPNLDASVRRSLPSEIQEIIVTEIQRLNEQKEGFARVLEAWAREGITSLLIKAAGYFPYTSDNIDVLIANADLPRASRSLNQLGYREVIHLREPYKWFYRMLTDSPLPPIHIHTQVAWINVFLEGQQLMDRGVSSDLSERCLYPSDEDVLLITLAHSVYEDKRITLRDVFHSWYAVQSGIDFAYVESVPRLHGWEQGWRLGHRLLADAAAILQLKGTGPFSDSAPPAPSLRVGMGTSELFSISRTYAKSLHFQKTWQDKTTSVDQKVKESIRLGWFAFLVKSGPLRRSSSILIAVSGQDGSGKTTVAKDTARRLEPFAVRTRYQWMRLGSSRFLEIMKSLLDLEGSSSSAEPNSSSDNSGKGRTRRERLETLPLLKELWSWVLLVDFLARSWSDHLGARFRGSIYIFDRHTTDADVDLAVIHGFRAHAVLTSLGPRPDLSVLLIAPPHIVSKRSSTPTSERESQESHSLYSNAKGRFDLVFDVDRTPSPAIAATIAESALLLAETKVSSRLWKRLIRRRAKNQIGVRF